MKPLYSSLLSFLLIASDPGGVQSPWASTHGGRAADAACLRVPSSHQDDPARKQLVASEADLPPVTFVLAQPLHELLESEELLDELARAVSSDLDSIFSRFEIADLGLKRGLTRSALHAALASGDWDKAAKLLSKSRALEEREDMRQIAAVHWEALILARVELGDEAEIKRLRPVFRRHLRALLDAQSWDLVHRELERRSGRMGLLGRGLLDQAMASILGPVAESGGEIEAAVARELLPMVNGARLLLPLKDEVAATYKSYLAANARELEDVWTQRTVVLAPDEPLTPVRLAVWDTGVDVEVFPDQLWTNPDEETNGEDSDGNGYVDDLHGIAYGPDLRPTTELLYPRHPDEEIWKRARSYDRGLSDVGASIDSPQARRLQRKLDKLGEEEVVPFLNELMHYALYSHGTHVAGIALEGNPFAELVVARIGLDHREPGDAKTLAWAHDFSRMCQDTVDYFVSNRVRIVNMSWGWGVSEIEENLRNAGAAGSDAERAALALEIHGVLSAGIESALASAPHVLFVCGAGNSGEDSSLDRFAPSSLTLPNLITIGGVDRAGGMAAFTSFGDHVSLYANGYHVESFVPGGARVPQSGTSMASPQAANLAAKLLAIEPTLTPEFLIERMLDGADATEFAGRTVYLMNARASVDLVRSRSNAGDTGQGAVKR